MKVVTLILGLLPIWPGLTAQSADTLQAYQAFQTAQRFYYEEGNFDSALVYYQKAEVKYQAAGVVSKSALSLLKAGFSAHRSRQYSLAETYYKRSLELYHTIYSNDTLELAAPNQSLGSLYAATGNYYLGLIHTRRALEIKRKYRGENHIETGVLYYNLGVAYMNYGQYDDAMDSYLKALPIYLEQHGETHQRLSSIYVNMGILFDKQGEPEKALEYYHKSIDIDIELYGPDYYLLAYNYYNMAISYMKLKNPRLAEEYYNNSVEKSEKNNLEQLHATGYYGLGNIAYDRGSYDLAMQLYQKSIDLFIEYFGPDFPELNHSYRAMAKVLTDLGAYQRAVEYLDQTLDLLNRNFESNHPYKASTHLQLASLQRVQQNFSQALVSIDRGLETLAKRQSPEGMVAPDNYLDQYLLLDLVREQGFILQEKYLKGIGELTDLITAQNTLELAIGYIDQIRRGYVMEESKLLLQEEAMETYEQALNIAVALYEETGDTKYLASAFKYTEKSKATLLAESLHGNSLKQINGVPDSVLNTEMEVRQKLSFTESMISAGNPGTDSLNKELFKLKRTYDTLSKYIEYQYHNYYELKYQVKVIELKDVQENLAKDQAVLMYFVGDHHWFVMALSNQKATISRMDTSSINQAKLDAFREMVSNPTVKWDDSLSFILYHQLVKKPVDQLAPEPQRLIIVPGGTLGHLPFDAFTTGIDPDSVGKKPYLVHRYSISYAPSLTLLLKETPGPSSADYLGFAPVYFEGREGEELFSPLPATKQEIDLAQKLFGGQTYLNDKATETNLKLIGSAKILHLAMHALVDDQDPMKSKLIFHKQSDGVDDGSLYASEIYNLELRSGLTVLSACNTGYGDIARGEGIMNLSRAFQYAGSPNIIMSLWQATDIASTNLIHSFFQNLKTGASKDVSLQHAKISYLSEADPYQSHPAHWATFVFLGNTEPLQFKNHLWRWLFTGGFCLLILLWFIKKTPLRPTHPQ